LPKRAVSVKSNDRAIFRIGRWHVAGEADAET